MKTIALLVGMLVAGYFIDSQFYHGYYFRHASAMSYQIAAHVGLRR